LPRAGAEVVAFLYVCWLVAMLDFQIVNSLHFAHHIQTEELHVDSVPTINGILFLQVQP